MMPPFFYLVPSHLLISFIHPSLDAIVIHLSIVGNELGDLANGNCLTLQDTLAILD